MSNPGEGEPSRPIESLGSRFKRLFSKKVPDRSEGSSPASTSQGRPRSGAISESSDRPQDTPEQSTSYGRPRSSALSSSQFSTKFKRMMDKKSGSSEGPPMTIPEHRNLSPIRSRPRSSAISQDPFARRKSTDIVTTGPKTSTPLQTSGFGKGAPTASRGAPLESVDIPYTRRRRGAISGDLHYSQLRIEDQYERTSAVGAQESSVLSPELPPMRRQRSSAISGQPPTSALADPKSPSPIRRSRSSAITGQQPAAADTPASWSPLPFQRQRSTAVSWAVPEQSTRDIVQGVQDYSQDDVFIPSVKPDKKYVEYDRNKRQTQAMSAFQSYDPYPAPGSPKQFGKKGEHGMEYPRRSSGSLGQSQTGYTARHPSEEHLPKTDDKGKRAVYGIHEGIPIQGAADWKHYYKDWSDIGQHYKVNIPIDRALTADEIEFCRRYGITFVTQLGRGSYGTVWLCNTTRLFPDDRNLACKILNLSKFQEKNQSLQNGVEKLSREADLQKQLNHRNIVKCEHVFYIHDPTTGFPFCRLLMFMEVCNGDIKGMLEKHPNKKFDEKQAMDMLNDVSDALEYMHKQNICHLDIKIHNIMYVEEGGTHICYKLADFGISKKYVSEKVAKVYGAMGTRMYMAPELSSIPKVLSESKPADIYSLGCCLAEVLTGRARFKQLLSDFKDKGLTSEVLDKWGIKLICAQLIFKMTDKEPTNRPTITMVRQDKWFASLSA